MTPEQLADQLRQSLGDNLQTVMLYGSAATGEFVPGVSDYNVLVVAQRWDVATLIALIPIIHRWVRKGNRPPLLFTPGELAASADAYPLEILDIRNCGRVLAGVDLLKDVCPSLVHLRQQLEREFRGKVLALREGFLRSRAKPSHLLTMLVRSLPGVLTVFRGALNLFETPTPCDKPDGLRVLAARLNLDPQPWLTVAALRRRELSSRRIDAVRLFDSCLQVLEQVAEAVDRHVHTPQ